MKACGSLLIEHAREKAGAPEGWEWYFMEALPEGGETQVFRVKGCVPNPNTKDRRKKFKEGTHHGEAWMTPQEHDAWITAWVARTGNCPVCAGKGQTVARVSVANGTEYRTCRECEGSGRALQCLRAVNEHDHHHRPPTLLGSTHHSGEDAHVDRSRLLSPEARKRYLALQEQEKTPKNPKPTPITGRDLGDEQP